MMKKVILSILVLAFPFMLCAQSSGLFSKKKIRMNQQETAYMQGAVPIVDGQVVFSKNIVSPSGNSKKVFTDLLQWANLRYMADVEHGVWTDADYYRNLTNAMVKSADEQTGVIVCQADEELVFTNKVLAKDYCKVNYKLEIKVEAAVVKVTISNISYVYNLTDEPQRLTAEEWITDEEAISRKGKLYRVSGKFRVKTIDLQKQLFDEIAEVVAK